MIVCVAVVGHQVRTVPSPPAQIAKSDLVSSSAPARVKL
jgi:hypothetical protein